MTIEKATTVIELELEKTDASKTQTAEIEYYYDLHSTKEDLMGESVAQSELIDYKVSLLKFLFRRKSCFVASNLNIYQTSDPKEPPLAPDVALFKEVVVSEAEKEQLRSWKMILPNRPAPSVVFEICSKKTWRDDLEKKPLKYGQMGVKEYFVYDPNQPRLWRNGPRLQGWRYGADKQPQTIEPDERGWLWSEELASWLVEDGLFLRLYDPQGQIRLTGEETERIAKEKAWARLRELGIDPENL